MERQDLNKIFKVSGRTLKTSPQNGVTLIDAILNAKSFVQTNVEGYTRVEFAYDNCYYVIAKLKDREPPAPAVCFVPYKDGYICTRDKGHTGPHRCYANGVVLEW